MGVFNPYSWMPVSKVNPSSNQSSNPKYKPCLPKVRWRRKQSKETIGLKACLLFFPSLNQLKAECTSIILRLELSKSLGFSNQFVL